MLQGKLKVGFVGTRGMVASVLIDRMLQEGNFDHIEAYFYSTSAPDTILTNSKLNVATKQDSIRLLNAYNVSDFMHLDCIVSTQGSAYTLNMLAKLRQSGCMAYYLDASSALRLQDDTIIVLDPLNLSQIKTAISSGIKNYSVGNCTVSCMLLAIDGLIKHNLIDWISTMTYQAVSGAGAKYILELLSQTNYANLQIAEQLQNKDHIDILSIERHLTKALQDDSLPKQNFKTTIAYNLIPWIDTLTTTGQTKEEAKAMREANKILFNYNIDTPNSSNNLLKIDGLCTRVGSLRCHSQALTIKLKTKNISLDEINTIIANGNQWVKLIPNLQEETLKYLNPVNISGSLDIAVGRVRKMIFGDEYISLFTVADQLLWGAAEPLRRMLSILIDEHN